MFSYRNNSFPVIIGGISLPGAPTFKVSWLHPAFSIFLCFCSYRMQDLCFQTVRSCQNISKSEMDEWRIEIIQSNRSLLSLRNKPARMSEQRYIKSWIPQVSCHVPLCHFVQVLNVYLSECYLSRSGTILFIYLCLVVLWRPLSASNIDSSFLWPLTIRSTCILGGKRVGTKGGPCIWAAHVLLYKMLHVKRLGMN